MPHPDLSGAIDLSQLKTWDVVDAQGTAHVIVADDLISNGPVIAFTKGQERLLTALFCNFTSVILRPKGQAN